MNADAPTRRHEARRAEIRAMVKKCIGIKDILVLFLSRNEKRKNKKNRSSAVSNTIFEFVGKRRHKLIVELQ